MREFRSKTTTRGPGAAGARALWRAGGMQDGDFSKPIIAVANSFTEFVPGHVHLQSVGRLVCETIWESGAVPREFNTIAVDDGIAMGHDGMLYSLPSRDLIADSIEYMVNAHCADALICLSNCDKITPGMLMAALRLNIPTVFVSGGPMEAGRIDLDDRVFRMDATDAYIADVNPDYLPGRAEEVEKSACPTCGSCSGMFTANSMNCLTEALGLALPGNGSLLATHADRTDLYRSAARCLVELTDRYYRQDDDSVLPRSIAGFESFENAMMVDIAMGGSTNTILHLLAAAAEAGVDFTMRDIDRLSREIPHLCKVSPATHDYFMEDVHRAGGIMRILGELERAGRIHTGVGTVHSATLAAALQQWDIARSDDSAVKEFYSAAPGGVRTAQGGSQSNRWKSLDVDRKNGCIRGFDHPYSDEGGLAVLFGNIAEDGCIVKTGSVDESMYTFSGRARVFEEQEQVAKAIFEGAIAPGDVLVVRYEGPKGGPGMQEMLVPTMALKAAKLDRVCALMTDGRFSGATSGLSIGHVSPEAANKGGIGLIEEGDTISFDIPGRSINLEISEEEMAARRAAMEEKGPAQAWKPAASRKRKVSKALRIYAVFATSADKGGVRELSPEDGV